MSARTAADACTQPIAPMSSPAFANTFVVRSFIFRGLLFLIGFF